MSLTNAISSSDASLKLSKKIVETLSEKFGFKFDDGWTTISSRTYEQAQKRVRREKKRCLPTADVKHPRTAYSFFTSVQRPVEQKAHPEATFGQLSGYVSNVWKTLTPSQQQTYKDQEVVDKARYKTESDAAKAAKAAAPVVSDVAAPVAETVVAEVKAPKSAKPKAKAAAVAAPVVVAASATVVPVAEVKSQKTKSPKAKATPAAPAVVTAVAAPAAVAAVAAPVVVAAPVAEVKAATKVKKDEKVVKVEKVEQVVKVEKVEQVVKVEQPKTPSKKSEKK